MCRKGRDDRSSGVVEEVSNDSHTRNAYQTPCPSFSPPARMFSGITYLCYRAHPYEEVSYEVYKMENV